jgi:hypothetical protein
MVAIYGLFQIKSRVQELSKELSEIDSQIKEEREFINILNAEWAYLNNPERLARLASKHLDIKPTQISQVKNHFEAGSTISSSQNKASNSSIYTSASKYKWHYKEPVYVHGNSVAAKHSGN